MVVFTGQTLKEWRLWGVWFKHTWFIGISKVDNSAAQKKAKG